MPEEQLNLFLKSPMAERFFGLWQMVGDTPMVKIGYRYGGGKECFIYAKCEQYNLTGSIKDRTVLYMLQQASQQGLLEPGDTLVEITSGGNMGISLAAIGRALGHRVRLLMPEAADLEHRAAIVSLGGEVRLISEGERSFLGDLLTAESAACDGKVFLPRQFENPYNALAHEKTTGPEIIRDLELHGLVPDAFVAGVGTGGTVMGTGNCLRNWNPFIKIHPLEPAESPALSNPFRPVNHRITGIAEDFIPGILDLEALDNIISVSDGDAILMAQKLAKELGLSVGVSSGANLLGAIQIQQEMGPEAVVVTVFPDSHKKNLNEEPVKAYYRSPQIKLTGYQGIFRN